MSLESCLLLCLPPCLPLEPCPAPCFPPCLLLVSQLVSPQCAALCLPQCCGTLEPCLPLSPAVFLMCFPLLTLEPCLLVFQLASHCVSSCCVFHGVSKCVSNFSPTRNLGTLSATVSRTWNFENLLSPPLLPIVPSTGTPTVSHLSPKCLPLFHPLCLPLEPRNLVPPHLSILSRFSRYCFSIFALVPRLLSHFPPACFQIVSHCLPIAPPSPLSRCCCSIACQCAPLVSPRLSPAFVSSIFRYVIHSVPQSVSCFVSHSVPTLSQTLSLTIFPSLSPT